VRGLGMSTHPLGRLGPLCSCSAGRREKVRFDNFEKRRRDGMSRSQNLMMYNENFEHTLPIGLTHVPPMPPKRGSSVVRELETLAELHKRGLLTDGEFHLAKKRLLEG